MALSFRTKLFSGFVNLNSREDGRYNGIQAGISTYATNDNGEEEVMTTYAELGGRSDHLANPILSAMNKPVVNELVSENLDKPYVTEADKEEEKQLAQLTVVKEATA